VSSIDVKACPPRIFLPLNKGFGIFGSEPGTKKLLPFSIFLNLLKEKPDFLRLCHVVKLIDSVVQADFSARVKLRDESPQSCQELLDLIRLFRCALHGCKKCKVTGCMIIFEPYEETILSEHALRSSMRVFIDSQTLRRVINSNPLEYLQKYFRSTCSTPAFLN
jgi:hypothetical protein